MVDVVLNLQQSLLLYRRLQLALPYGHHPPTHLLQFRLVAFVALLVASDFLLPIPTVGMRNMPIHLMPVPKAPVDENHDAILAQHNIRCARQPLHVLAVTVAARKEVAPHNPFRLRVLALDFRHDGGAFLFVPDVHA